MVVNQNQLWLRSQSACYHSVQNLLSSRLLSKNLKIEIYWTIMLPVVLYGCETWSLKLLCNLPEQRSLYLHRDGGLTHYLLTWIIWWAPNNANKGQIGFNSAFKGLECPLTLTLLTWIIWWAPNNANKGQIGFNSAFKWLNHAQSYSYLDRKERNLGTRPLASRRSRVLVEKLAVPQLVKTARLSVDMKPPYRHHENPVSFYEASRTGSLHQEEAGWNVMAHAKKPDFVFRAKRTSQFKSARWDASVHSTAGSRGVRISGSNAGYTVFQGSVKSTGYPLHSPVSPSLSFPCGTVCHHISTEV